MAYTHTIFDDFSTASRNVNKWEFEFGGVSQAGGQLTVSSSLAGQYSGYTAYVSDFTSSYAIMELVSAGNQSLASWEVYACSIYIDNSNGVFWLITNGTVQAYKKVANPTAVAVGSSFAYNSVNHRWFKISESGGTFTFSYSADGKTWTNHTTLAVPFALTSMKLEPVSGNYAAELSTTTAVYDNINITQGTVSSDYVNFTMSGSGYTLVADSGTFTVTGTAANTLYNRLTTGDAGTYTVTGTAANLLYNKLVTADGGSIVVTGTAASLLYNRLTTGDTGTYTVTGTAANLVTQRILTADTTSFSVTGTAANLVTNKVVTATGGSYTVTGTDATFLRAYAVAATNGTYTVSGTDATLQYASSRTLVADAGSFTVTGTDATFVYNHNLTADTGSITASGTAANLLYNRLVTAATTSYAVTGTAATLLGTYILPANAASYTITGTPASLVTTKVLTADTTSYAITGTSANFVVTRTMPASEGSYVVTGTDATLTYNTGALTLSAASGSFTITGKAATLYIPRPPRNYYIDTNGNVYWVISQTAGIIEKI